MSEGSEKYVLSKIPSTQFHVGKASPEDLYVFVQSDKEYILFAAKDEVLTEHKVETIIKLNGVNLYVESLALKQKSDGASPESGAGIKIITADQMMQNVTQGLSTIDSSKAYVNEILSKEAEASIKAIYVDLIQNPAVAPLGDLSKALAQMSEKILAVLVPEIGEVKVVLLKNLMSMSYMSHAASITTLALLISLANDFNSKTAFRNLSLACLVMDAGLGDLEDHWLDTYYIKRSDLPTHIWERIKAHPVKSQQLVAYTSFASEILGQMILNHHELYNGTGYHRGLHSASLPALVQILAMAVDLFEMIRHEELTQKRFTLKDIFIRIQERGKAAHEKRHNSRFVDNLHKYLGLR